MAEKTRVVYYPTPETPLTDGELSRVMGQLGKRDALWLALMQILQMRLASAISDAAESDPKAAGRLAEITELQEILKKYRDRGLGDGRKSG